MEYIDPEWIKSLAVSLKLIDRTLTNDEIKLIRDLFMDYHHEGLESRKALEKAVNVFNHFHKNKLKNDR